MTVTPLLLLGLIPAMVIGRFAHECCHALAVLALGGRVRRLRPSVVEYELPADAPARQERYIGVAPLVSGMLVGVGGLVAGPPTGSVGVLLAAGWAVYTFWGDPATDYGVGEATRPE